MSRDSAVQCLPSPITITTATGAEQYNSSQVYDNGNGVIDTPKGGLRELFPGFQLLVIPPAPSDLGKCYSMQEVKS